MPSHMRILLCFMTLHILDAAVEHIYEKMHVKLMK